LKLESKVFKTETTLLTFADDSVTFTDVEQEVLQQEEVYQIYKDLTAAANYLEAKAFLNRNVEMFLNEKDEGQHLFYVEGLPFLLNLIPHTILRGFLIG
jgi:hypothetical protein